jgi:hypothetical protein
MGGLQPNETVAYEQRRHGLGRQGHAEQLYTVGNLVRHKRMREAFSTTLITYCERCYLLLIPNILCLEVCPRLSDPQARRGRARRVPEQKDHHRLRPYAIDAESQ